MLLSPADRGPASPDEAGHRYAGDAWLAAPLAETSVPFPRTAGSLAQVGLRASNMTHGGVSEVSLAQASMRSGGCFVRPLPLDLSCAGVARRLFREAVAGADLPDDLIHDGVTMASELAANTLNAHGNIEFAGTSHRPVTGIPEFWMYLRAFGSGLELVCKIFDSEPAWEAFEPAAEGALEKAHPDSVRGRGLQLVAGLSAGRWGHHPTRGRLGAWKVPGKAVWFALRVPPGNDLAYSRRRLLRGWQAIDALVAALTERGLRTGLVQAAEAGGELAVLSVRHRLTVWCHGDVLWWRAPDGGYDRLCVSDLEEAAERIVCAHEELQTAS
jgi:hypothetical protein